MASTSQLVGLAKKKTLHVVAFDVSASMRAPLNLRSSTHTANQRPVKLEPKRVQTVFDVICRLAEDSIEAAKEQDMYAAVLCFGLRNVETCDLLALLELRIKKMEIKDSIEGQETMRMQYDQAVALLDINDIDSVDDFLKEVPSKDSSPNEQQLYKVYGHKPLINLLAKAGAPYCNEYVEKFLTPELAGKYFMWFAIPCHAEDLQAIVVSLPDACKERSANLMPKAAKAGAGLGFMGSLLAEKLDNVVESAVDEATRRADKLIAGKEDALSVLKQIPNATPKSLGDIIQLLKQLQLVLKENGENEPMTNGKTIFPENYQTTSINWEQLLDEIEYYLYGWTPMCQAFRSVWPLFRDQQYSSKVMLLISDGDSTDGDPRPHAQAIRNAGGMVFACLLTSSFIKEPRELYSPKNFTRRWSIMFNMASTVSCDSKPVQILRRRGWKIPASGKCKLFIQANNPIIIDEFTSAARHWGTSSDALAEIIGQISLDDYIQKSNHDAKVTNQGTRSICWAHATASVIHLALNRVVGRTVPEFPDIRSELLTLFGDNNNGQYVGSVLERICPKYRLRYKECDEMGARAAIYARRPVIATFWLDGIRWDKFTAFYNSTPKGVLTAKHMRAQAGGKGEGGHAVVLVRCDDTSLTFMNSWGPKFADDGFFKVDHPSTLAMRRRKITMQFYDVYWTTDDLSTEEIISWKDHETKTVDKLIGVLPASGLTSAVIAVVEALKHIPCSRFKAFLANFAAGFVPCAIVISRWGGFVAVRTSDPEVMERVFFILLVHIEICPLLSGDGGHQILQFVVVLISLCLLTSWEL